MKAALLIAAMGLALTACSERPQARNGLQHHGTAPWTGASKAFTDPAWKVGDKSSWEAYLKVRTERGQNDYYGSEN